MRLLTSRRRRIAREIIAVLDPGQDLGIKFQPVGRGSYTYPFKTRSGRTFKVNLSVESKNSLPVHSEWEVPDQLSEYAQTLPTPFYSAYIDFTDEHGSHSITGGGEVADVLSKVSATINQFLQANPHIAAVTFSGEPKSRVRVYQRLSKMLGGDLGYASYITGNGENGNFLAPSPYFSAEATKKAPELGGHEGYGESDAPDDEDEEEDEEALERSWEQAQERYDEELESHLDWYRQEAVSDEAGYQRESYTENYEDERREEYVDTVVEDLYLQMLKKHRGDPKQMMLFPETPAETAEVERVLLEKAQTQAKDMVEVEWESRWEETLDSMENEFEEYARESIEENSVPYWTEQWESEHNVEDYLE